MARFVQLHFITSYPPSNLNRDDMGNPKTAFLGGSERLRVSSQSLKRAWRTSEAFQQMMVGCVGTRTKLLGVEAFNFLKSKGITDKQAKEWAAKIADNYGKRKSENGKELEIEQLVHISPEENRSLKELLSALAEEKRGPTEDEVSALLHENKAVDIAMFGRMLAAKTEFNGDAAVQVAHAIGVHASVVEDDYFTAVDDLNTKDPGAAHIGENAFAAAVFYQYICIDRGLLKKNLGGDEALTERAIKALVQVALTVAPGGKQNSYASRAYAYYALAEKGDQQPRSLSLAFVKPVNGADYAEEAVRALERVRVNMDKVYGPCADSVCSFDVLKGEGSVEELVTFAAEE